MREILFKAKRKSNGEWIEGYYVVLPLVHYKRNEYLITDSKGDSYEIDPSTLCQYTGLTDKNGKKIFENDIINKVDTNALGWHRERICTVSWNKGYWQIMTEYGDSYWIGEFDEEQLEVLGNVFDNPELL